MSACICLHVSLSPPPPSPSLPNILCLQSFLVSFLAVLIDVELKTVTFSLISLSLSVSVYMSLLPSPVFYVFSLLLFLVSFLSVLIDFLPCWGLRMNGNAPSV